MSNASLKLLTALEATGSSKTMNSAILNNISINNLPEAPPKKKHRPRHRNKNRSTETSPAVSSAQGGSPRDLNSPGINPTKSQKKNIRVISNSNLQKFGNASAAQEKPSSRTRATPKQKYKPGTVKPIPVNTKNPLLSPSPSNSHGSSKNQKTVDKVKQVLKSQNALPSSSRAKSKVKDGGELLDYDDIFLNLGITPPPLSKLLPIPSRAELDRIYSALDNLSIHPGPSNSKEMSYCKPQADVRAPRPPQSKAPPITFKIKNVRNPTCGKFIRPRSNEFKYINVRTFIKKPQQPCSEVHTQLDSSKPEKSEKLQVFDRSATKKNESQRVPKKKRKKSERNDGQEEAFPEYITLEEVNDGLKDRKLVKGFLRINPKNSRDSYVSNEDTSLNDYYLTSVIDRNRAFDGDEVVLEVKPEKYWNDGQKTATVVYITEKVHPRITIGLLSPGPKNADYAVFEPRDKRCPRVRIPETSWPNGFKQQPEDYKNIMMVVKILTWTVPGYASGVIMECLGQSGDLKVESMSILKEFCLDITPFKEEVIRDCLPKTLEIPEKEFDYREDIRKDCVFTIDPETARDLDDAVSVKLLENGNYEVGVHISDASFYLEEGTELDQEVCKKATTIYMVEQAFHMLPLELCLFCSLLPGEDKLSFSIFWEMSAEGEVVSKRFSRTIMNSCTKLAYEHAQMVIENPDKEYTTDDFPKIHNGFGPEDIAATVKILQKMAINLRQKRVDSGALKIEQTKLMFALDPATGEPLSFSKYESKEAHRLIEEFMLLANISVAEKIYEHYPTLAFLRCHDPPKHTMLIELQNSLASCGIHIDISSSGGLSNSLKKYITEDYAGICRSSVLNHLTAKAMTRAKYFCAALQDSELDFNHYALSVPIYTHFTSPIRRYADIMVHRLLAASLDYEEPPKWSTDYVAAVAANCNGKKYNAKRAGEASCELYLSHYIAQNKPFVEDCVVVEVRERSFDCIVLRTGSVVRIYNNNCEIGSLWTTESIPVPSGSQTGKRPLRLTIQFKKTRKYPAVELIVEIFSIVKISLEAKPNSYKLEGVLYRPLPANY